MSLSLNEKDLPAELTPEQSVEAAYAHELAEVASKLNRGLPSLIECDKDLAPFVFLNLRTRLREHNMRCRYLDGRPRENEQQGPVPVGIMGTMINQLRDAVRGATEQVDQQGRPVRTVIVLPHLDLLTTSQGGLTGEAREVIVLLYENPTIVFLGFELTVRDGPDGKMLVKLVPHARFREANYLLPSETGERAVGTDHFPAAGFEVALSPSEFLVIGTDSYREGTLGHATLTGQEDDRAVQRLLVLRAGRTKGEREGQFPDRDSQAVAPPIASQATAARGVSP